MAEYGGVSRTLGLITLGTPHHDSVFAGPRRVLATRPRCLSVIGSVFAFLFTNTPGANDLAWDNAPGLRQFDNHENDELLALNSSTIPETDSKTVAFYGTIERGGHGKLGFTDGCLKAIGFQRSDGVVVEESGRNSGASLANTIHFRDYNHSQMLKGKGNDKCLDGVTATSRSPCLFVKIRDQICTFANLSCVNRPPIANAGPDQTVQVGSTVQLDGSGSSDPDGDTLRYTWRFISRPAGSRARLSNPRIAKPTFKADKEGDYVLELKVDDGRRGTATDQVKITAKTDVTPAVALLAGTVETDNTGRVYRYKGGSQWEAISEDLGRGVTSLVEYNSALYAGTYVGLLYRYENGTWTLMCNLDPVLDSVLVLVVYTGNLYIGTFNGRLYRLDGPGSCTLVFDMDWGGFQSAYVWGDYLYLGSIGGSINRFNGSAFEHIVDLGDNHVYDFVSYQGELYAAVCGNTGTGLYKSVDGINWVRVFTDCFVELEVFQGLLIMGEHWGEGGWTLHWFNGTDRGTIWAGSGALGSMVAQANERLYIGTVETGRGGRIYTYDGSTVTPISGYLGGVYALYIASGSSMSLAAFDRAEFEFRKLKITAFQRDNQLIKFQVGGLDLRGMQISIFNLSGQIVFYTDWVENSFGWNLTNNQGQPLTNGVYLYVVRVRGFDGREYVSAARKLVILR